MTMPHLPGNNHRMEILFLLFVVIDFIYSQLKVLNKCLRKLKNEQSRDTGNIGYTRHMAKTKKTQKTKKMGNRDLTIYICIFLY
jgi:hypothetical protein